MPLPLLSAPRDNRGLLAVPDFDQAEQLLARNQTCLDECAAQIAGRRLVELRRQARDEAIQAAQAHLDELGIPPPAADKRRLILTGHQPELVHPGVWIKNFAVQGLARRLRGTAVNLVVDSDHARATSIRVPRRLHHSVEVVRIPFDLPSGDTPYEELPVQNEEVFGRFPAAVEETLPPGHQPFVREFWGQTGTGGTLGDRFTRGRRRWEEAWSCRNLELPLSRLCRTAAFAHMAAHLFLELPRLHADYNRCLREYRRQRHIRSRNHPVPELGRQGGWLEAPFWAWRPGDRGRRPVFGLRRRDGVELRMGSEAIGLVPGDWDAAVREIGAWERRGVKVRTRALMSTLFARVLLADLFLHGIGGGIYDELTDSIMQTFLGVEPPAFMVLSGTLHLPFAVEPAASSTRLLREIRDLWFNPDRHLGPAARERDNVAALVRAKEALCRQAPATPDQRLTRFREIRKLNAQLRPWVALQRERLLSDCALAREQESAQAILLSREYSLVLHPRSELESFARLVLARAAGEK